VVAHTQRKLTCRLLAVGIKTDLPDDVFDAVIID
jgi:hypothetical protein